MPSKYKSPYATSFKSAIKRGTPCGMAVQNIATRCKKTPKVVFESLWKAGLCHRQKVAGEWVYWPTEWNRKTNATQTKQCQNNMWQWFVDWCFACGFCKPEQLAKHCGSQQEFMSFCKKYFGKQFTANGTTKSTKRRKSTHKNRKRTATPKSRKGSPKRRRSSTPRSYKFPGVKSRSVRRYRKVA